MTSIDPPTALVHLLGAADLGLRRGGLRDALDTLLRRPVEDQDTALTGDELAEADTDGRTDQLPQHAAFRPLASALYELAAAGAKALDTLVLVATEQPGGHPDDTAALASLLRSRISASDGDLFGIIPTRQVHISVATTPTLDAVRTAVQVSLTEDPPSDPAVAVTLAGGATGAFLGLLLGVLESGRQPMIIEANRQDTGAVDDRIHPLTVDHDTRRWAAASGNIPTLRSLIDRDDAAIGEALFAVHQLDWARLARTTIAGEAPWSYLTGGRPPVAAEDWTWQRHAFEAAITWRLARGDRSVLHLLRPWIEVEYGRCRAIALRDHANTDELPQEARVWMQEPHAIRDRAPEPIRSFLSNRDVRWYWDKGRSADHGGHPDPDLNGTTSRWALRTAAENPYLQAQASLCDLAPMLPGTGILAVQTIGLRDAQDGHTPMLDAVLAAYPADRLHLRLITTEETASVAAQLTEKAGSTGVDARTIEVPEPYAFTSVRDDVLAGLVEDPAWKDTQRCALLTGPGTKAMSIGALSGLLTAAYNHARPVEIGTLVRASDATSTLVMSPQRIAARLAHDSAIEHAAPSLLNHLDLHALEQLLNLGSNRWEDLADHVRSYRRALYAADVNSKDLQRLGIEPVGDAPINVQLWRARTRCLRRLIGIDTWSAIYLIAAAAERTRRPWRGYAQPCGEALWRLRNDSPYGHHSWASPPPRRDAERLIDGLLDELPQGIEERALLRVHVEIENLLQGIFGSTEPR